jgi:hypothetical protein
VLERFPHLRVQGFTSDSEISGRSKDVQHARPRRAGPRPSVMHDVGVLEPALVARLTNEGHGPEPRSCYFLPLADLAGFLGGLAGVFCLAPDFDFAGLVSFEAFTGVADVAFGGLAAAGFFAAGAAALDGA